MNLRTIVTFLAATVLATAGGFNLEFGNPKANSDPKAQNAAVIVRAVGCHEPEKALVSGTAEGIVDGKRQSIPLKIIPLSTPGTYAVEKQWPDAGKFTLVFNAHFGTQYISTALLPLKNGVPERSLAKVLRHEATPADLD